MEKAGRARGKKQAEPERALGRPPYGDPPRAGRPSLTAAGPGRWTPSSRLPCVPGLVPPRWSAATTHLRALLSHGFLGLHEPGHSLAGSFLASLLR